MSQQIRTAILCIIFIVTTLYGFAQAVKNGLQITHLTGNFYVFTTYQLYQGNPVPANGMYLVTGKGVVMFDTPWDAAQLQPLLDSIQARHHQTVSICIATHFHEDKTRGLTYYQQQGIQTFTTKQTDTLSVLNKKNRAAFLLYKDSVFNVGQYTFETFYPGRGHTADNIVLWFPKDKVLYGGCLVKSVEATDLGNLSDAYMKDWAGSIENIRHRYKNPAFVITGHQSWLSTRSLQHTLDLVKAYNKKKPAQQ